MRKLVWTFAVALPLALGACGGDGGGGGGGGGLTAPTTPAAAITATGDGMLTVHPSLQGFNGALEAPVIIRETSGGSADWTSARFTALKNGQEIGRREITADVLAGAGFTRIAANQNESYVLVFHINSLDFDAWTITLRFADRRDGRLLTVDVPGTTWDGVDISFVPLTRPEPGYRLE
jgi:hypothetical protein